MRHSFAVFIILMLSLLGCKRDDEMRSEQRLVSENQPYASRDALGVVTAGPEKLSSSLGVFLITVSLRELEEGGGVHGAIAALADGIQVGDTVNVRVRDIYNHPAVTKTFVRFIEKR